MQLSAPLALTEPPIAFAVRLANADSTIGNTPTPILSIASQPGVILANRYGTIHQSPATSNPIMAIALSSAPAIMNEKAKPTGRSPWLMLNPPGFPIWLMIATAQPNITNSKPKQRSPTLTWAINPAVTYGSGRITKVGFI